MKLPDTNIWLALSLSKHSHHLAARTWLEKETKSGSLLFCRSTQQSFLRLLTTAGVLAVYGNDPLTNQQAWAAYESFLTDDRILFQQEPAGMEAVWKKLAARRTSSPKLLVHRLTPKAWAAEQMAKCQAIAQASTAAL